MCDLGTAILGGAGVSAGGGLLSGLLGSSAAQTAASQQAATARQALQLQQQILGYVAQQEQPFISLGQGAAGTLAGVTPGLTTQFPALQPFAPTMTQLAQTPGYQFTLGQGEQAVQNAYAAQGLGSSGAALKGAANYAEGLAGTTFQQQFQNYLQQQGQQFSQYWTGNQAASNILLNQAQLGAGAASTLTGAGVNLGNTASSTLGTLGAAQAAGTVGSANALIGGVGNVAGAAAGALPAYALAPLTAAALAAVPGMYGAPGGGAGQILSPWPG